MPAFPQYYGSEYVGFANYTAQTAAYTANAGDFVEMTGTTTVIVTLPQATTGGPVAIKQMVVGTTTGAITVVTNTLDGTGTHAPKIDGIAGTTGVTITTQYTAVTFASDGTNWWRVGSYGFTA